MNFANPEHFPTGHIYNTNAINNEKQKAKQKKI